MHTLPITLSIIANVLLIIAVLYLMFSRKVIQYIKTRKNLRETQAKKERALEKANLVKQIRYEVRRYLEELQNE